MKCVVAENIREYLSIIISNVKNISFEQSKQYLKSYFDLIESLDMYEGWKHPGTHIHHIIPRSLNKYINFKHENLNTWESGNLVRVSSENHTKLHIELSNCTNIKELNYAALLLIKNLKEYENLSNEEKERLREFKSSFFKDMIHRPDIEEKRRNTMILKYGDPMGQCRTKEVIEKQRKVKLKRYGCWQPNKISKQAIINAHTKEAIEKRKLTNLKRYGNTEGLIHTSEVRLKASKKATETINTRYGNLQNVIRSPEVNERLAKEHNGDPYWHIHTKESAENHSRSTGTPIYKISINGEILKEYWGINKAAKEENSFSNSRLKICVRNKLLFKGFYWIKVSEYENWYKEKFSSTTISKESTPKQVETPNIFIKDEDIV